MTVRDLAHWVTGFVAAEGTLVRNRQPTRTKFMFAVELGETDAVACELLRAALGCGTVHHHDRRQPHHDDSVRFQVSKLRDLVEVVVPFLDEHLPPSHKRRQYEAWRVELLEYWEHQARRARP